MPRDAAIVTGAAGFIGSHLATRLLRSGRRVVGVDNFDPFYPRAMKERNLEPPREHEAFELREMDILDRDALRAVFDEVRPGAVFHIAALAGVRPSVERPDRYARVNVDGLVNVLDAARAAECPRVIFASSSSVYGNNEKVPFAEEDRVDEPISPYAATKKAGELIAHAYAHLHGLHVACLRFFTVFGPAQRPDLAIMSFMRRIARGEPITMYGDGTSRRDYTYVDDVVDGVIAASERIGSPGIGRYRIWNLGHSEPISLREMVETISEVVGRVPSVERAPMPPGDVRRTYADLTRSRAELGYDPRTPFREGVERQWAWLRPRLEGEGGAGPVGASRER